MRKTYSFRLSEQEKRELRDVIRDGVALTPNGCWEWKWPRNVRGYGLVSTKTKGTLMAHRLSYCVHVGPLTPGLFVMHLCNNPPCVNPEHLKQGSHDENIDYASACGRIGGARPGAGRPKKEYGERLGSVLVIRCTPEEKAAWWKIAAEADMSFAQWARLKLGE